MLVHGTSITVVNEGRNGTIQLEPKDWRYVAPIMPWRGAAQAVEQEADRAGAPSSPARPDRG